MKANFRHVGIVMAMQIEAARMIRILNLAPLQGCNPKLPMQIFVGQIREMQICLAVNGRDSRFGVDLIGSQPAVLSANYIAEQFKPDLIINAGTAGGIKTRGAQIGDVYLSKEPICFHDRRYPIPGFQEYGVGSYPALDVSGLEHLGFKLGRISSGDSLYISAEEAEQFRLNDADVKDMEAASVAWVASLHGVPFVAVKAITDLIDDATPVEDQFVRNARTATEQLSQKLFLLLNLWA